MAGGETKLCFILARVQLCNPGRGRGGENEGGEGPPLATEGAEKEPELLTSNPGRR